MRSAGGEEKEETKGQIGGVRSKNRGGHCRRQGCWTGESPRGTGGKRKVMGLFGVSMSGHGPSRNSGWGIATNGSGVGNV